MQSAVEGSVCSLKPGKPDYGGKQKGRLPYEAFYDAIISIVNAMLSDDALIVCQWWNECGHVSLTRLLFITISPEPFSATRKRGRRSRRGEAGGSGIQLE